MRDLLPDPRVLRESARSVSRIGSISRIGAESPLPELPGVWSALAQETHWVRDKYRALYSLPVIEHSDGSRSFHDGLLYRVSGVNVLLLRGDYIEMAFQHGRLLADQIPHGAVQGSSRLVNNAIANSLGPGGAVQDCLVEGLQRYLTSRSLTATRRQASSVRPAAPMFSEMIALADGAGLCANQVVRALFGPEMLLVLARMGSGSWPICCSSFAAWGSYTRDGELLIGRNLDYPLNGFYDQYPTVIYYEPTSGLRHMSFASAGVHSDGITSYNEAGVFLAAHVVPCNKVSLSGVPVLVTADLAVSHSETCQAAAEVLKSVPPVAGWSYLMANSHQKQVGSLEMTHHRFAERSPAGDCHVQTNHFLSPEMKNENLFLNTGIDEDSEGRYQRVQQRLDEARGRLDAEEAISILSDQVDPADNQVRGIGNTVGVHTTMTSLVFDPARKRVLMSTGRGPSCHSDFLELPLPGSFDRSQFPGLAHRLPHRSNFAAHHPEKLAAVQLFIRAKMAYEYQNDCSTVYQLLQEVVETDSSNPAYYFQLGIFALKQREYQVAIKTFEKVLSFDPGSQHLRRLAKYYRGRTHAHLRNRDAAIEDLSAVLDDEATDPKLRAAVRTALWRTKMFGSYRLGKKSLGIMMQHSDMVSY